MLVALIQELSAAYPPLVEAGALAAVSYRVKQFKKLSRRSKL